MTNYNIFSYILQVFSSKRGGKIMKLSELQELIEKFGDVKLLEITEELKKLGYSCKIAGEVNA